MFQADCLSNGNTDTPSGSVQRQESQALTYEELSEKSGVSSRYIKEIENHGNVPSIEKLGQLIRALHISADPFFYPNVPADYLDYQRLLVYLSQCTEEQITTILAIVEAYLRTYKHPKE